MKLKPGEFELIELLTREHIKDLPKGVIGPGDDCAVIDLSALFPGGELQGKKLLLTTDLMVEDRHFRISSSPQDLGWKLLAVNISDIAAMGGAPVAALVTLQLSPNMESFAEDLYGGIYELAAQSNVSIVGGDVSSGDKVSLGVTLVGTCEGTPLLRSAAKAGDLLYLSGKCGFANVGFRLAEGESLDDLSNEARRLAASRFARPVPRVELGCTLQSEALANAAIDISDGLVQDASHIAKMSGVSAVIDLAVAEQFLGKRYLASVLCGGEDYELLFSAAPEHRSKLEAQGCILVGKCTERLDAAVLVQVGERRLSWPEYAAAAGLPASGGFEHFS
ncbi:MAG: thiamine-phosphate kinase [Deltaproteobacteria bacterium]|nr:thiamine-phosphate kinase [Deltaproteobacteria bacterium]